MSQKTKTCGACGAAIAGRFCSECGAAAGGEAKCRGCGLPMPAGARFCPGCGQAPGATRQPAPAPRNLVPYVLGGVAFVALLAALFIRERTGLAPDPTEAPPAAPFAGAAPAGTPPDISQMSPRERFDRLYNRVMQAAEGGDSATVTRFTPMALEAYRMLGQADTDARYHAAMLNIEVGDAIAASALADSILATNPKHLLGLVIQGNLAMLRDDAAGLAGARKAFLAAYDAEEKAARSEYQDHQQILDRFRAEAAPGGKGTTR